VRKLQWRREERRGGPRQRPKRPQNPLEKGKGLAFRNVFKAKSKTQFAASEQTEKKGWPRRGPERNGTPPNGGGERTNNPERHGE